VGSFEKIGLIGKGGFSKVYLVRKKDTGEVFAMKVIKKQTAMREKKGVEYCETERKVLDAIKHPFIVGLQFAFQTRQKVYMVLDYANGGELFFHLRRRRPQMFDEATVRFYAAEIVLAFELLHKKGIIYRDLKPENIVFGSDGHVLLTDFGLAKELAPPGPVGRSVERAHSFCGTAEYMAPEMIMQDGHDAAVDWWSLGCLCYELLSGSPPFVSRQRQVNETMQLILRQPLDIPHWLSKEAISLISGLLERDPARRLGYRDDAAEIKAHPFFRSIDWVKLYNKELEPPIKPVVTSVIDTSNFDPSVTNQAGGFDDADPDDPYLNERLTLFRGFSFDPTQTSPTKPSRAQAQSANPWASSAGNMTARPGAPRPPQFPGSQPIPQQPPQQQRVMQGSISRPMGHPPQPFGFGGQPFGAFGGGGMPMYAMPQWGGRRW
jgi:serine/threonine protein kinase